MMENSTCIAVDTMGSDLGTAEVVAGAAIALRDFVPDVRLVLVGDEEQVDAALTAEKLSDHPSLSTFATSEVIGMEEKPIYSIRQKRDSSLVRSVELVKVGTCDAAVSCGNTGSLMACSTLRLRPLEGVSKPALATIWPSKDHHFVLLDAGANPQCKVENLVQYAILGSLYARTALEIESPRIGLLSIGTEDGKGTDLTSGTHEALKRLGNQINYAGMIEGFQVFENHVDVVVTDGFTGNVVLKTCESLYRMMKSLMREEVGRNPVRLLGAACLRGAFRSARGRLDPDRFGGAPMLGLRGMVIKAHGSSNRHAIANAIRIAARVVEQDFRQRSHEAIAAAQETLAREIVDGRQP